MPIEAIALIPAIKVELAVPDRLERQDGRSSYTPSPSKFNRIFCCYNTTTSTWIQPRTIVSQRVERAGPPDGGDTLEKSLSVLLGILRISAG